MYAACASAIAFDAVGRRQHHDLDQRVGDAQPQLIGGVGGVGEPRLLEVVLGQFVGVDLSR